MSIRATVDGQNYNGITKINAGGKAITLTEQGTITTPTQTKNIDSNGTYDVTNFAQAIVNVPTGGGSSFATGTFVGDGSRDITIDTGKTDATSIVIIRNDMLNGNTQIDSAYKLVSLYFRKGTKVLYGLIENYAGNAFGTINSNIEVEDVNDNTYQRHYLIDGVFYINNMTSGGGVTTKAVTYTWFAY